MENTAELQLHHVIMSTHLFTGEIPMNLLDSFDSLICQNTLQNKEKYSIILLHWTQIQ